MDPYERADITSNTYWDWVIRHAYFGTPVQQLVATFLATFKDYPPWQRPASFSIDQIMEKLQDEPIGRGGEVTRGFSRQRRWPIAPLW